MVEYWGVTVKNIESLRKTFLFRDMPAEQLHKLLEIGAQRSVGAGVELFREGAKKEEFFVLLMGTVKVSKRDDKGIAEEIATLGTGSYFGEVELLNEEHQSAATVVTQEPTTLLAFSHRELCELCDSDHNLGSHFYRAVARGLARRLVNTTGIAAHYRGMVVRHRD
jgi:CRP-like cAMP-binding protein